MEANVRVRTGPVRKLLYGGPILDASKRIAGRLPESVPGDPVKWIESQPVIEDGRQIADRGHVWSKQREIVAALAKPRARVLVHASQGNGKTWLGARLGMWFMLKHRGMDARVIIVGPSWDQLDGGLLHEFRRNADLYYPGKLSFSRRVVELDGVDMISWRSPPEGQSKKNPLQGIHSDYLLVLIEEASNFGYKLWNEATVAITSGGDARILAFGNAMDTGTPFHQSSKPNSGWHVIHIGTKHSPNLTGEKVPAWLAAKLPTKEWAERTRRDPNVTDAEYRARVEGLFPNQSEWALIESEWIERAIKNDRVPSNKRGPIICVDPGSGGDPTVALERNEGCIRYLNLGRLEKSRNREEVAAFIGAYAKHHKAPAVIFDSHGVGASYGPVLARAASSSKIVALNSGDKQEMTKRESREYYDPRAVMGWRLADQLQRNELVLPDNLTMSQEVQEMRQMFQENGLRRLEKKEDMAVRINRSPNHLDTLLLSTWLREGMDFAEVIVGRA